MTRERDRIELDIFGVRAKIVGRWLALATIVIAVAAFVAGRIASLW